MTEAGWFTRPRLFWRASGIALSLLAIAGFAVVAMGDMPLALRPYLRFDTAHNVLHAALAVVSLGLGFAPIAEKPLRRAALALGIVYLALAVVGFINATIFGLGRAVGMRLEILENLVHLLLGAWGAYVGSYEE